MTLPLRTARGGVDWILVGAGALPHAALAAWFPLARYIDVPLQDLGKLTGYGGAGMRGYVAQFAAAFALYLIALWRVRRPAFNSGSAVLPIAGPLLFAAILAFLYPIGGLDLFDYVAHARVWLVHGENPFVTVLAEVPGDPYLGLVGWPHAPAAYGGLWMYASAPAALLPPTLAPLLYFKALAFASFAAGLLLVRAIGARLSPGGGDVAAVVFGWNPLVLIETTGNGHNDALMMVFALAALLAVVRGNAALAAPLVAASAAVKFITAALWLLVVLAALRDAGDTVARMRTLAIAVVASSLVIALSYAPFWSPDVDVLTLERRKRMFTASPAAVLHLSNAARLGEEASQDYARQVAMVAFLAVAAALLVAPSRAYTGLLLRCFGVLLAYTVLAAIWFQPWYLVWIVALAAAVPNPVARVVAIVFTASAQWNYVVFDFLWIWWNMSPADRYIQTLVVAGIFAPPLVALVVATLWLAYTTNARRQPAGLRERT